MNRHGQSMIEYMFIAILIILGIVIMGPYVLRSVNAHFKLWDESVQDSATENLTQAPLNDVPSLPLNCTCHYVSGNCGGSGIGGAGACGANQREYDLDCGTSPQGCSGQPASTCQDDPLCCTVYSPQGCGTIAIGTTPLPAGDCYYGQRIYANQCPGLPIECETDPTCNPACMGIVTQGAAACPNEPPANGTALDQSYGVTYVYADNQADCADIPGCTAALCSPPGGTPSAAPGGPNCTYCNPAQYCQYYTSSPAVIKCLYNGSSFSGSYEGVYEGQCAYFTNVAGGDCGRSNGSSGSQYLTLFCTGNNLTGMCAYPSPHYELGQTYRGIDNQITPNCNNGGSDVNILCNGISGPQTYYWENCNGESSCYDGMSSSCPSNSYQLITACQPWSGGSCPTSACSNDSFTITCGGSGLQSITINDSSPSYPTASVHGCNWSGAQTLYDFGGGNDMTWTCDVSSGQGVLTQVNVTGPSGGCSGPNSPSC